MPVDAIAIDNALHHVHFLARRSFYLLVFRFQLCLKLNTAWLWPRINNLKPSAIAAKEDIQSILIISLIMITSNYPSIVYCTFCNPFGFASLNAHLQLVLHGILGLNHNLALGLRDSDQGVSRQWREG